MVNSLRADVHRRLEMNARDTETAMEVGLVGFEGVQDGQQPCGTLSVSFENGKGQSQDVVEKMIKQ